MSKTSDILVLGATGLTGRQATRFLAAHPDRTSKKFTLAIAARSKQKLDALVSDLSLAEDIGTLTLDVTNEDAVNEVVKQTRIVVNTVGPYYRWGTPVVRACARHGIHYVDLTGESLWVAQIIRELHNQATETRSIIVPACGLDSIPSDISVYIANKALKDFDPSLHITTTTTVYEQVDGIISSGTLNSSIVLRLAPKAEREMVFKDYLLSPVEGARCPQPRPLYKVKVPGKPSRSVVGSFWMMALPNRSIVQRSWGLLEQEFLSNESPSAEVARARYGPSVVYDEFLKTRGSISAVFLTMTMGLFWGLLGFAPFRSLILRVLPGNNGIKTDEDLEKGMFKTTNVTTSSTSANRPKPVQVTTTLTGKGDPGYLLSPILMAECALPLLNTDALPELARRGGILTPATAFGDVLVERLEANERFTVQYQVHTTEDKTA
ncbi:hypothetical protein AAF712_007487 [Marasmius tenuissimus]|uniref:Saccharopine dehydrogenase NADP binding domain-containing protein n=1 Tax=Marasmius tenuissimus TaxID=585030 RepID=A0ABR2ZVH2_9AGAR